MRIEDNCIAKGLYGHPQDSGYLSVKQFIIVEQDGKKCLLLRFENEASFDITRAEFTLKQLNSNNEVIDISTIKYSKIKVGPGEMYVPKDGIALKEECFDFVVQMRSLVGGGYLYRFNNGIVTAHYNKVGYNSGSTKKKKGNNSVKVKRSHSVSEGSFHRTIAFLSLILLIILFAVIICYHIFYAQIHSLLDSIFSDEQTDIYEEEYGDIDAEYPSEDENIYSPDIVIPETEFSDTKNSDTEIPDTEIPEIVIE